MFPDLAGLPYSITKSVSARPLLTITIVNVFQSLLGGEIVTTATTTMRKLKGCNKAFAVKESRLWGLPTPTLLGPEASCRSATSSCVKPESATQRNMIVMLDKRTFAVNLQYSLHKAGHRRLICNNLLYCYGHVVRDMHPIISHHPCKQSCHNA